jgi:hypothetical protein
VTDFLALPSFSFSLSSFGFDKVRFRPNSLVRAVGEVSAGTGTGGGRFCCRFGGDV